MNCHYTEVFNLLVSRIAQYLSIEMISQWNDCFLDCQINFWFKAKETQIFLKTSYCLLLEIIFFLENTLFYRWLQLSPIWSFYRLDWTKPVSGIG